MADLPDAASDYFPWENLVIVQNGRLVNPLEYVRNNFSWTVWEEVGKYLSNPRHANGMNIAKELLKHRDVRFKHIT